MDIFCHWKHLKLVKWTNGKLLCFFCFPSPTQLYCCLLALRLRHGHHKDVTKDAASPSLPAAWRKADLHTQSRFRRILLAMRASGGSWVYSSRFSYILTFYPLKTKKKYCVCACMCTCALCMCACACNTVCVEVRGQLHKVCSLFPSQHGFWWAESGFQVCTVSTFTL